VQGEGVSHMTDDRVVAQLKPGGKMVIPTGLPDAQQIILVDKDASDSVSTRAIFAVRFSLLDS
jgi:protein-L-isoaspartate(D-aspartate) O-methyltransferase